MKWRALWLSVVLPAALVIAGFGDMTDQNRIRPFAAVPHAQPPIPGTVSRAAPPSPPPLNLALIERGQGRFDIYCAPCHGRTGDGKGMVVERGFPAPPSYFSPRLLAAPSRHFFDVITKGYGAMYPYGGRIPPRDRWAIVAYIRALQFSQHADVARLTPEERRHLP